MTEVLFFSQILEFTLIYAEWIKQKLGSLQNAMPHCPNSWIVSFALLLAVVLPFFLHCTWCLFFVFPSLWLVKCPEAVSGVVLASTEATFVVCSAGKSSNELLCQSKAEIQQCCFLPCPPGDIFQENYKRINIRKLKNKPKQILVPLFGGSTRVPPCCHTCEGRLVS